MPADIRDYVTKYRQEKRTADSNVRALLDGVQSTTDDTQPSSFQNQFATDSSESSTDWSSSSTEADMGLGF